MKKIVILACKMIREQNLCPGDAKCLVAFMRKEGEFERYKNEDAAIVGIMDCGGCEGNKTRAICSLLLLKTQLSALKENVDVLHIGTCIIKFCPRKDDIIAAVKEKAGVEVIEGTHKYAPATIFGN
ncbi:predicted metal-binding protein [Thermodesulfovibrio aggregans]|uniref:Predicted metal-binding protein n=1 Tax=Thermodesulfovibrio aggregans TaxID=86166 RepID=A0A0U9HX35_9BACT|nr:CGGC domain-containing protein [Thermodesulfovibrio aggregans]GAQ94261.1 predicted metal-binding protein [Thermodesulfovibrio aggregans]